MKLVIRANTLSGTIEGTIEMSSSGAVIRATGAGVGALRVGAVDPETGDRLTVGDGIRWLLAVRYKLSHSCYSRAEVIESDNDPRAATT